MPSSLRLSLLATKEGRTVLIVGHGPHEVNLPVAQETIREVNILGPFRYRNWYEMKEYSLVQNFYSQKTFSSPYFTNTFPLSIALVSSGMQ